MKQIIHPYERRCRVAHYGMWVVWLMLVNFWVDVSDWSFRSTVKHANGQAVFDDYDSLFEWLAEACLDIEDAMPENTDGAPEEQCAKLLFTKIKWWAGGEQLSLVPAQLKCVSYVEYQLPIVSLQTRNIWSPPPNNLFI